MFQDFSSVLKIIAVIIGLMLVTAVLRTILGKIRSGNHRIQTAITLIYSLIQYVAFIVGMVWVLNIAGVDVGMIFASVGIVALIVGFSAESLIADVITGLFMIFENQFNVGDVIEVDGYRGTVEKIGIRTVSVRDAGDNLKIVNNSKIKTMVNLSSDVSKAVCDIHISYEDDLETVESEILELLEGIYKSYKEIFLSLPQYSGVQELTEQSLVLRIVAQVDERNIFQGRRILNRELYLGLKKKKVHIFNK